MGTTRNGARTFLDLMAKACRMSHLPGFRTALEQILGTDAYVVFLAAWEPLCVLVDGLIASDDWFNQKDRSSPSEPGGEDIPPL